MKFRRLNFKYSNSKKIIILFYNNPCNEESIIFQLYFADNLFWKYFKFINQKIKNRFYNI